MTRPRPIDRHRLIGDGVTAALITPDAVIDWWCAPTFDGEPLLWSLLDPAGAESRWLGTRYVGHSSEPAGATTRTVLSVSGRRVECWDGLCPRPGGGSELIRLVRALDAGPQPELVHEVRLGGFDGSPDVTDGWSRTTVALVDDRWGGIVIGGDRRDASELATSLDDADREAAALADGLLLPSHHGERSRHAIHVLRACTDRSTGAVVASPTTSLPEAPGGDRQWDYRYSWLRDSSLAVSVAAQLGAGDLGQGYVGFLRRLGTDGILTAPLTDTRGGEVPAEHNVPGVAGWDGEQPVRVGNDATGQLQYDALASVLEGILVHARTAGRIDDELWSIVRAVADRVTPTIDRPSSGVWELREPAWLVAAEIGRFVALDRAIRISRWRRPLGLARHRRWRSARADARARVISALRADGSLPQSFDGPGADRQDASALLAVILGVFTARDPRADRLIDATRRALGAGPFVYRYEPDGSDGLAGVEGVFVAASWWVVSALAIVGRLAEAEDLANEICAALPALLPEEVDPVSGEGRGNVPLVWSHIETARALHLLEVGAIRRRWGRGGVAIWRGLQYARLRRRRKTQARRPTGRPPEGQAIDLESTRSRTVAPSRARRAHEAQQ